MKIRKIHHVAIICSDYQKSKDFYTRILGLTPQQEVYRKERDSYMLNLAINGDFQIELFSFPDPPERVNFPEASGLRHLAFEIEDIEEAIDYLVQHNVQVEPIRVDPHTNKKHVFFLDPDGLPIELYEK